MYSQKEGARETLQKIVDMAEEQRAFVYENQGNLFFILSPSKTRSTQNEKTALIIAQNAKEILDHHNKIFKVRIDYGISLNRGSIIAKQERDVFMFMGLGNFLNETKKISNTAQQDIFLGEKMNEKLSSEIKTEKHKRDGVTVFLMREMKSKTNHENFLKSFVARQEKEFKPDENQENKDLF